MSLRQIAPFLIALSLPLAASAAGKGPLDTLKEAQGRLDKLMATNPAAGSAEAKDRRAKLEVEAKALFNAAELAKRALGKNWASGTAAQQTEFVTLFSDTVRTQYLDQI